MQDAAKGSGVDLTALTPAPLPAPGTTATGPKAAVPEIKVTMTVAGSYFQIMDFVNRLNTEARLVVVDNVSLSGQIDQAFASIVITSLLSIGLVGFVALIERLALPWYFTGAREWSEPGIY